MKKSQVSITAVVVAVLAGILGSWAGGLIFQKPSFDAMLVEAAQEINKTCPFLVDRDTRLDGTLAGPGMKFTYTYTMINYLREELDSTAFRDYMVPQIVNNVRTHPEMARFREQKVTLVYDYKDKLGNLITSILVTPEDYE